MSVTGLDREARVVAFDELAIGQTVSLDWSVEAAEIDRFSEVSSDRNPLHMQADFARSKGFSDRVAHGFLLGAKVSALVGMLLPGRDCLILEQGLAYPKPVYPGDLIRIEGQVDELSSEQRIVKVRIRAHRIVDDVRTLVARGFVLCRSQ